MRRSWKFWLLAVLVLFVCVAVWLEPTEDDLFELCSTQGKPVIYRSVEAEGYYYGLTTDCRTCWIYLENTDYRFIEFSIAKPLSHHKPITEPGIYRVSRISANSELCDAKLTSHYQEYESNRRLMDDNNWCFKVERFDKPRARYGEYLEPFGYVDSSPISGSKIIKNRVFWLDHEAEDIIAEYTNFSMTSFPFLSFSSFNTQIHCNSFVDELGSRGIDRRKVVVPPD